MAWRVGDVQAVGSGSTAIAKSHRKFRPHDGLIDTDDAREQPVMANQKMAMITQVSVRPPSSAAFSR